MSGANLSGVHLSQFSLENANFVVSNLSNANIVECYFNGSNLSNVNLSNALIDGWFVNVNFAGANLRRAILCLYNDLNDKVNFKGADLTGAIYYSRKAQFSEPEGVDFSQVIRVGPGADVTNLDLSEYNYANLDILMSYLRED